MTLSLDRLKWGISGAVILAAVVLLATMLPALFSRQSTRLKPISDPINDNQSLKDAPDENFESVEIEVPCCAESGRYSTSIR